MRNTVIEYAAPGEMSFGDLGDPFEADGRDGTREAHGDQ